LKLQDDGCGIDRQAICDYLKRTRSLSDEEIEALTPEQFYKVILNPDFSSAIEVTDLAGRGIGMNVVAQAIEYLGGTLAIRSTPGEGTEFIARLPLSLSVIHGLVFELDAYRLAVPSADVVSIEQRHQAASPNGLVRYNLKTLFDPSHAPDDYHYLIRLKSSADIVQPDATEAEIGLAVDQISGNKQLMIMPVGDLISKTGQFTGMGIMEDGGIAVLLDTTNLPMQAVIKN
jgi:chemotaxis protein histidine kinase CheA